MARRLPGLPGLPGGAALTPLGLVSRFSYVAAAFKIRVGQVWRKVNTEESFLVTRLYTEALATIAVLRPVGQETTTMLRVKIEMGATGQNLPGFSMTQDPES